MNPMLKYWPSADEINNCIKHEAEGTHEAVLLAVHRPAPLSYKEVSSGKKFDTNEEELFQFLVSEDVPSGTHVIPITGASGVGKSHLVRILNAKIQGVNKDERYVVIRIPKSASLRRVVELILEQLPGDEYAQVRAEFEKAFTDDPSVETAVVRFQGALTIALAQLAKQLEARVRANPTDTTLKEQLGHARALPKFIGDPVLVDHFRENIFPRFVHRAISGQHLVEEGELVKDFTPEDFLLPESLDLSRSAQQTNAYYIRDLLARDRRGLRVATSLLNDHLVVDHAIRQLFNLHQSLGGMTLQEVILEIRRRLLVQGRELMIFVEDFKALTGIQDVLLKVLIQEGIRDGVQELATLRSVIAVTDGYLDTQDTIATRAKREWRVESELPSPEEVLNRTKALVANYLNAARWGFKALLSHFEATKSLDSEHDRWIGPYVDQDSSENSPVLAAFGYQNEIPLFPYTEAAIEQLARTALTRNDSIVFNPRFVIDNVLRSLLLQGRHAFEKGEFPPPSIKASVLSMEVDEWLSNQPFSPELQQRYKRVIAVWGNNPKTIAEVSYIPGEVFDAFSLHRPNLEFQKRPEESLPPQPKEQAPVQARPEDDALTRALEKWAQGERLPQNVANQIRKSVAAALNDRIDWVAERCLKSPLQLSQISIPNAGGQASIAAEAITVVDQGRPPTGQERLELAAVTRLYHLNAGKMSYIDADDDLVWIGNLLDRLMPQALSLLRSLNRQRLNIVLRLLQTNSQVLGQSRRGLTPNSLASFLFADTDSPAEILSTQKQFFVDWNSLQKKAYQIRVELIQMALSLCGSFQGTTGKTPYAIDMVRVTNALEQDAQVSGVAELDLPSELKTSLSSMTDARVNLLAGKVLQDAKSIRANLASDFGENFNKQEIVDEFKALAEQLGVSGVWPTHELGGMRKADFLTLCESFRSVAIREAMSLLSNGDGTASDDYSSTPLKVVGRLDVNPLILASNFKDAARKLLAFAEKHTSEQELKYKGIDPVGQATAIQELLQLLAKEIEHLSETGGETS